MGLESLSGKGSSFSWSGMFLLCFQYAKMSFWRKHCRINRKSMSWRAVDNALRILLGMLLGPGVFPLASSLRMLSKTSLMKFQHKVAFFGVSCLKDEAIWAMPGVFSDCTMSY